MSRLLRPSMWTESTMIVNQERVDVLSVPTLGRRFKMVKKTGDLLLELAKLHLDRADKFGSIQPSLLRRIQTRLINMEINDLSAIDDSGFSTPNVVRDVLVAVKAINVLLRIKNPDFSLVVEFVDRALKPI